MNTKHEKPSTENKHRRGDKKIRSKKKQQKTGEKNESLNTYLST